MDSIQKLIDRLMTCKLDGDTLALANQVKSDLEGYKGEIEEFDQELQVCQAKVLRLEQDLAAKSAEGADGSEENAAQAWKEKAEKLAEELFACEAQLRVKSAAVDRMATEVLSLTESTQASLAKATQLANQRDQVQRELDATVANLKRARDRVLDLGALCDTRLRYMQRTAEALAAAEKDLADLRWLVRWARQGATAPVCASVNPPPHVGGHSASAQAEGGVK